VKSPLGTILTKCLLFAAVSILPLGATQIDFEAQAANKGGTITAIPDPPLTIDIATFTGGELRNGIAGLNADQTGMYVSEGLFGSGETNPLIISFATPISGFSIFVANSNFAQNFSVSDNIGDSETLLVQSSGGVTFALGGNGITQVDVASSQAFWDFAIDNVSFTPATSAPEPGSFVLLGFGLLIAAVAVRGGSSLGRRLR
jgi:PEP-CTERM motif